MASNFALSLGESWSDDKENAEPVKKKLRLSLNKKKPPRYEFLDDSELQTLAVKYTAKNTASTKWALKNFEDWKIACRVHFPEKDEVPDDLLSKGNPEDLCKFLSAYAAESRKQNGSPYPPKTVYCLLTGLLRHSRTLKPTFPNFLDTDNPDFSSFHACIDNLFRRLRTSGIGSESKSAAIFTKDEERKLWDDGVLGLQNPKALLRSVFFSKRQKLCSTRWRRAQIVKAFSSEKIFRPRSLCLHRKLVQKSLWRIGTTACG